LQTINAFPSFAPSFSSSPTALPFNDQSNWYSISSSDNGNVIAAIPGSAQQFFEVFTFSSGTWSRTQISLAAVNSNVMPASVAVSGDGSTLAIGLLNDCGSAGTVAIWSVSALLANPTSPSSSVIYANPPTSLNSQSQYFGDFISLSVDGTIITIGDDGLGSVYIYTLVSGSYSLSSTIAQPATYNSFAQGVNYAPSSNTILIGGGTSSQNQFALASPTGSILLTGSGLAASNLASNSVSSSPSISRNGKVIVVGGQPGVNSLLVYQSS